MKVVFMGTPHFAVSIFEAIHSSKHEVVAAVTATDKPAGRGRKLQASAVKLKSQELGIPVLQPEKLKEAAFIEALASFEAVVFVVVAFRMLPKEVWGMPEKGTFNLHASLLPQYRGAAPINWAIVNGEKETGLSTFFIDEKIDTGSVISQRRMPIGENETAGSLHDRMMTEGAELVLETLNLIENDKVITQQQIESSELKAAPKIYKEDLRIDLSNKIEDIHNLIRGMSPFPGAWCEIEIPGFSGSLKLFETRIVEIGNVNKAPGTLWTEGKKLYLACINGVLELLSLQMQGKKRLKALDFLNGQEIDENSRIS